MIHSKFTISDTWAMGEGWWEPWWDGGSGTRGRTSCKCQDKRIFRIFVNVVLNFSLNICSDIILKLFLFVNRYFQVVLVCIS